MMIKKINWKKITLLGVVTSLSLFVFFVKYSFESHYKFSRNSLPYIFLTDSEIKNIPAIDKDGNLIFNYIPHDGPNGDVNEVVVSFDVFEKNRLDIISYFKNLKYDYVEVCEKLCVMKFSRDNATVEIYRDQYFFLIQKISH
jgi:hypothetical protein